MTRLVGVRAVCDGCSAAAATVFCVSHRHVLCPSCDAAQHARPPTASHQRVDLTSAVTALPFCERCDDAPATTYCENEGTTLCDKCDRVLHSSVPHAHCRTSIENTLRSRAVEFRPPALTSRSTLIASNPSSTPPSSASLPLATTSAQPHRRPSTSGARRRPPKREAPSPEAPPPTSVPCISAPMPSIRRPKSTGRRRQRSQLTPPSPSFPSPSPVPVRIPLPPTPLPQQQEHTPLFTQRHADLLPATNDDPSDDTLSPFLYPPPDNFAQDLTDPLLLDASRDTGVADAPIALDLSALLPYDGLDIPTNVPSPPHRKTPDIDDLRLGPRTPPPPPATPVLRQPASSSIAAAAAAAAAAGELYLLHALPPRHAQPVVPRPPTDPAVGVAAAATAAAQSAAFAAAEERPGAPPLAPPVRRPRRPSARRRPRRDVASTAAAAAAAAASAPGYALAEAQRRVFDEAVLKLGRGGAIAPPENGTVVSGVSAISGRPLALTPLLPSSPLPPTNPPSLPSPPPQSSQPSQSQPQSLTAPEHAAPDAAVAAAVAEEDMLMEMREDFAVFDQIDLAAFDRTVNAGPGSAGALGVPDFRTRTLDPDGKE